MTQTLNYKMLSTSFETKAALMKEIRASNHEQYAVRLNEAGQWILSRALTDEEYPAFAHLKVEPEAVPTVESFEDEGPRLA